MPADSRTLAAITSKVIGQGRKMPTAAMTNNEPNISAALPTGIMLERLFHGMTEIAIAPSRPASSISGTVVFTMNQRCLR